MAALLENASAAKSPQVMDTTCVSKCIVGDEKGIRQSNKLIDIRTDAL